MGSGRVTDTPRLRLDQLSTRLGPAGLNVVGVADPAAWDAVMPESRRCSTLLPGTRAILVVGSGGPALWEGLLDDCRAHPEHWSNEAHPLDARVRRVVESVEVPGRHRWFFAAAEAELHLDFRLLASLAGLGGKSRMGLLLHPVHGLWLGLRAACFLDSELPFDTPDLADPCAGCPGYCASACPGSAFPGGTWDVARCTAFHAESERCATRCDARLACPKGAASRYPDAEIRYHYDRGGGRRVLREALGITDDRFEGEGPHWGTWSTRVKVS